MGAGRRDAGVRDTERLCATNLRAQGCRGVTSDQWGLVHGEERLIRDERAFGGNFQQASMERGKRVLIERRPIRDGEMAAVVVVGSAVMVFTIIGKRMMIVPVVIVMLMGVGTIIMI